RVGVGQKAAEVGTFLDFCSDIRSTEKKIGAEQVHAGGAEREGGAEIALFWLQNSQRTLNRGFGPAPFAFDRKNPRMRLSKPRERGFSVSAGVRSATLSCPQRQQRNWTRMRTPRWREAAGIVTRSREMVNMGRDSSRLVSSAGGG